MPSVKKSGFYLNGRFLGEDASSAMQGLDEGEIFRIASEYHMDAYTDDELYGDPVKDPIHPNDRQLAGLALERIRERAAEIGREPELAPISYGDVRWFSAVGGRC